MAEIEDLYHDTEGGGVGQFDLGRQWEHVTKSLSEFPG